MDQATSKTSIMDAFTVDLTRHIISAKGGPTARMTETGDVLRPRGIKKPRTQPKKNRK